MSSTQEKRCRTCVHWGLDMICQNEDSGEQGYTCMAGAACSHWEGTGEQEVRRGRWIEHGGGFVVTCSNCNATYRKDVLQSISPYAEHLTRHCPNCGERMDGGV